MILRQLRACLDIEGMNKKWGVRSLFLVLFLLRCQVAIIPFGDSDFASFWIWYKDFSEVVNANDTSKAYEMLSSIPLTTGNWIYLLWSAFVLILCVVGIGLYAAMYIRSLRIQLVSKAKEAGDNSFASRVRAPISVGKLVFRLIIGTIAYLVVFMMFFSILSYFAIVLIFITPIIVMIPAFYLSGDAGLIASVKQGFTYSKGYFFSLSYVVSIVLMLSYLLNSILSIVGNYSEPIASVLVSFVNVYSCLAIGRAIGISYCNMIDRVFTS